MSFCIVECVDFDVEVSYHLMGHHFPATDTTPDEWPDIIIDECHICCGDLRLEARFALLSVTVQERVLDIISQEEFT